MTFFKEWNIFFATTTNTSLCEKRQQTFPLSIPHTCENISILVQTFFLLSLFFVIELLFKTLFLNPGTTKLFTQKTVLHMFRSGATETGNFGGGEGFTEQKNHLSETRTKGQFILERFNFDFFLQLFVKSTVFGFF